MSEIKLVSEDRRRGRVRPTRLALVGGGVILVLAGLPLTIAAFRSFNLLEPIGTNPTSLELTRSE